MEEYFIADKAGSGEIIEKKSRFIAQVFPIREEQEALSIIDTVKKKYWDARHNCYAYVIGKNNEIQRFSDDGEPQGTAGKPILEVITGTNLRNTLIIVTRYFGGTLLGTGGLVRAYAQASKQGIENAIIKKVCTGVKVQITVDYNSIGKVKYIISQIGVRLVDEQYGENVLLAVEMPKRIAEEFKTRITDATNGQAMFDDEKEIEYKEDIL